MTLETWLAAIAPSQLHSLIEDLSNRKLHLLAAAFLRRVWDDLPSHQTRTAVEATEKFADGLVTIDHLARLRSIDLLESCESLWLGQEAENLDELLIGRGWDCPCCEEGAAEYECRATTRGKGLVGVRAGVKEPGWIAVQAAFWARESVAWSSAPEESNVAESDEATAQFALFREIVGPARVNPRWPQWRTDTVRLVARAIHRSQAFEQLPILADALQDADCDDESVLNHYREVTGHARGCWVLDLAMGIG